MKLRICINFNNGYPEKRYTGCIHGKEKVCSYECPQYMTKTKDPTRYSCNWLVKTKCARNLSCEGHCPEYINHKPGMERGVSPLEGAFQKAIEEGQELVDRPLGIRLPDPDKKKYKGQLGAYKCPKCGNEQKGELTRLRLGWWMCRECGWEGLVDEKPRRVDNGF